MKRFLLAAAVLVSVGGLVARSAAQVPSSPSSFARPDQARFRLLAEEGIVQPDGRAYVTGTKIWTVADKISGQCYVLFLMPGGTSVTGPIACPQP